MKNYWKPLESDSIDILNLSPRTSNALIGSHIKKLISLIEMDESDILKIKGIGILCLNEIKNKLNEI